MDELQDLLRQRAERAFGRITIAEAWDSRRAIIGTKNMPPVAQQQLAEEALEILRNGGRPSARQLAALELTIRLMRPAPLSKQRQIDDLPPEAAPSFPQWSNFRESVKPFLYSIGRIDLAPGDGIGTGFLVSDTLLVTNRHVLDALSCGTEVLAEGQAVVRFKHEYQSIPDEPPVGIKQVVAVHETLDMALLEVEKKAYADHRRPLEIDPMRVECGIPVVAVGYPFDDPAHNPLFISAIFGNRFGVKRAAPGEVLGTGSRTVYHDCSTLGGNSGSPILSMTTRRVVGLHSNGIFRYRNEAVDGTSLSAFVNRHVHPGEHCARPSIDHRD